VTAGPAVRPLVLLGAAVAAAAAGFLAARAREPGLDFLRYQRAGTLVARGEGALLYDEEALAASKAWGDPGGLPERRFRYPPAAAVVAAPLGGLPPRDAWPLWAAACAGLAAAGAGAAAVLASRRLTGGRHPWLPAAAAVLPLLPVLLADVAEGQMAAVVFGLALLSALALDRGRDRTAGVLAGLAASVKLFPVLLVLWFAWKRRWRAAAWGLAGIVLFFAVLPAALAGPASLLRWGEVPARLVTEVDEAPGTIASPGMVYAESQSLRGVMARWCTPTRYLRLREQPLERPPGGGDPGIAVHGGRSFPSAVLGIAWALGAVAVLGGIVLLTAPPPGGPAAASPFRFPLEAGLLFAAFPILADESRWTHLPWLAPALAALAAGLPGPDRRGPAWWAAALAVGASALLLPAAGGALGREVADALLARGAGLLAAVLLFAACAVALHEDPAPAAPPGLPA
jgi:hypothetical protein